MSNYKQSSVEFFLYEMFSLLGEFENKALPSYKIMDLFEQAKAMHKEEMLYAIEWGNRKGYDEHKLTCIYDEDEQYYNETFGGTNENNKLP